MYNGQLSRCQHQDLLRCWQWQFATIINICEKRKGSSVSLFCQRFYNSFPLQEELWKHLLNNLLVFKRTICSSGGGSFKAIGPSLLFFTKWPAKYHHFFFSAQTKCLLLPQLMRIWHGYCVHVLFFTLHMMIIILQESSRSTRAFIFKWKIKSVTWRHSLYFEFIAAHISPIFASQQTKKKSLIIKLKEEKNSVEKNVLTWASDNILLSTKRTSPSLFPT